MFSKKTTLSKQRETITVVSASERRKFVLGAFNAGEGRIARAQRLAAQAGKNPQSWSDAALQVVRVSCHLVIRVGE